MENEESFLARVPRHLVGLPAFLVAAVLILSLTNAAPAVAISRDAVIARAQTWVDKAVPYSQAKHFGGYRTDCSGYVSMCWSTGTSWSTRSFHTVTHTIPVASLTRGDAMLKAGYHIMLFYGWTDEAHTQYLVYEESGPAAGELHDLAKDLAFGYVPTRYDHITNSPLPSNRLLNPTFDVWTSGWQGEHPVWWATSGGGRYGDWNAVYAVHQKTPVRTSRSSMLLLNPAGDPGEVTEMSQSVRVEPNQEYRLDVYALTAADPASVRLGLRCLDASGTVLAESSADGKAWGLTADAFRRMGLVATTPPGTVSATVLVSLAGGTDSAGTAGTAVSLDDISLRSPARATMTSMDGPAAVRSNRTAVFAGTVSEAGASGTAVISRSRYVSGLWRSMGSVKVAVSGGKFAYGLKTAYRGRWHLAATYSGRTTGWTTYVGSRSEVREITVK